MYDSLSFIPIYLPKLDLFVCTSLPPDSGLGLIQTHIISFSSYLVNQVTKQKIASGLYSNENDNLSH